MQSYNSLIVSLLGSTTTHAFKEKRKLFDALFRACALDQPGEALRIVGVIQRSPYADTLCSLVVLRAVVATGNARLVRTVLQDSVISMGWFYELFALSCQNTCATVSRVLLAHACPSLKHDEESTSRRQLAAFFDDVVCTACDYRDRRVLGCFISAVNLTCAWYRPCVFKPDLMTALCVANSPVFDAEFASPTDKLQRECLTIVLSVNRSVMQERHKEGLPEFDDHPMAIALFMEDAHALMELARCGIDVNMPYHHVHGPLVIYAAKRASDLLLCQMFSIHDLDFNVTDPAGNGLLNALVTKRPTSVNGADLLGVLRALLFLAGPRLAMDCPAQWRCSENSLCVSLLDEEYRKRSLPTIPRTTFVKRPRELDEDEDEDEDEEYRYGEEDADDESE